MLKKAITVTALVAALGAGHSVMAQPPGGGGGGFAPPSFADYDKDKNGKITKEEMEQMIVDDLPSPWRLACQMIVRDEDILVEY